MHNLVGILIGGCALAAIVIIWGVMHYIFSPRLEEPDGEARITGRCGDTMELHLKFKDGKIADTTCWTDGCVYSFNSLCAAAELAKGKTPDEALKIDAEIIKEYIGGLPSDHLHCAQLAEETLQAALNDYMVKITKQQREQEQKAS
ncbi:MAG: iron-sulfur cluster assembly scaffold protein [Deltaproteobacteria bacterium]|nr:MAG: iron-sulfur cluster assembly scaffold protein [Deltaproteobacteria bacterium]